MITSRGYYPINAWLVGVSCDISTLLPAAMLSTGTHGVSTVVVHMSVMETLQALIASRSVHCRFQTKFEGVVLNKAAY